MGFNRFSYGTGCDSLIIYDQHERVGAWVSEKSGGEFHSGMRCIGLEKNKKLVAGVIYEQDNGKSLFVHVAVEKNWFNREFLYSCFHYPFIQIGSNVLIGVVPEENVKARKLDEHLGFKLSHIIPDAHPKGGLCVYTMYKNQCRWINHGFS